MGLQGLNFSLLQVPIASGLDTKGDPRAASPPQFDLLRDAEFEEPGGLQTRKPYAAIGSDIFGGGTLSSIRRIFENGDELLCFTSTALYSWNAQLSKWVLKGTHLACKVDEVPRLVTPADQVDCDRAELAGTIVYTWAEGTAGYVAAIDKTTGAILMAPTALSVAASRLRVTALATKILLSYVDSANEFYCYALDPAAPATAIAGAATTIYSAAAPFTGKNYYDIVKIPSADTAFFAGRLDSATSYVVAKITAGLAVTTSVKARVCDGPIAVSCEPTGTSVQIIRGHSTDIQGDFITISSLADVTTGQAIGTSTTAIAHITAAHRSTQDSSAYRCYAFWSYPEVADDTDWVSRSNWVDTAGSIGAITSPEHLHVRRQGIASRAFGYDGRVYVWGVFAGASTFTGGNAPGFRAQLQNTYFLHRDDAFLVAKAVSANAGGFQTIAFLPGVALTSGSTTFSWCGAERQVIDLGVVQSGYGALAPRDVTFTFDANEARRVARLGRTLYVSGGEILQYDGAGLFEVGFHVYPWRFAATETAGGAIATNGDYAYKVTLRWPNAAGEQDRSTTATVGTVTLASAPGGATLAIVPLYQTHKTANPPAVEVWRTVLAPLPDSPFHLVTSKNPASTSNPNRYLVNAASSLDATFNDELADSDLIKLESSPENGAVLENLAPPAASIILATDDRLFLAGVAGDPNRVWYSKQRNEGEVAAFHDALTINVPHAGGVITALAILNETLIVFCETAVYTLPGQGLDNLGAGQNYGPAQRVPGDVGAVSMESVALTPMGLLFKSSKGFYILSSRWACEYVGGPVVDFDSDTINAIQVVEHQHQVRVLTSARMLVLDYLVNQWSEWTIADGVHSAMWNGAHHYATATAIKGQLTTFTGVDYGLDCELAWLKPAGLQGRCTVRDIQILGAYLTGCRVRVRLARDYLQDGSGNWSYFDDETWTVTPTTVGGPLQVRHGPSQKRCESIKVRITVLGAGSASVPSGEALRLTGIAFDVGVEPGLFAGLASAQKQ